MERARNRNKAVRCNICSKCMRSDHLKRYMQKHKDILSMTDDEAKEELRARHTAQMHREERRREIEEIALQEEIPIDSDSPERYYWNEGMQHNASSWDADKDIRERLIKNNKIYKQKLKTGEQIYTLLLREDIAEESLEKRDKEALDLYRKQSCHFSLEGTELRPWQNALFQLIQQPSRREIIWVKGVRGNEGKTWFQNYIQSLFGCGRVAQLDLKAKTASALHALRKFPLATIDVFFFNVTRAINYETCCYDVLELVKDGMATASKFNSEVIRFRTPNVVVVFSNHDPDVKQMSKDRWKIYYITKDGLNSHEERIWKERHTKMNKICASILRSVPWVLLVDCTTQQTSI